jgi:hypothetical protein
MAKSSYAKNAPIIYRTLLSEGFSDIAAKGALARIRQESGFNPKAINKNDAGPGLHSQGIFQWNRDRLDNLKRFGGKNWQDVETQARFFAAEAKGKIGGEGKYGSKLLAAKTPEQAAEAVISMARPSGWTSKNPRGGHGWNNTVNWARNMNVKAAGPSTLYARNEKGAPADGGVLDNVMLALTAEAGQKYSVPQGTAAGITSDGKLADSGGGALSVVDFLTMPTGPGVKKESGVDGKPGLEVSDGKIDPADLNLLPRDGVKTDDGPSDAMGMAAGLLKGVSTFLDAFNSKEATWLKSPGQRHGTSPSHGLLSPRMVG